MQAGALRERIRIERQHLTADGAGGQLRAWVLLAQRSAAVLPANGRETLTDSGPAGVQSYRITIRHGAGVRAEDRIVWKGAILYVRSAVDPDGRRKWQAIAADAGLPSQ